MDLTTPSPQPFLRSAQSLAEDLESEIYATPESEARSSWTHRGCRVEVRASERDSFAEFHVTGLVECAGSAAELAEIVLEEVASVLASRRIQPIQEKLYGLTAIRGEVMKRRETAYRRRRLDPSVPTTWIQGLPLLGCDFVGIQIWGVAPYGGETCVTTVENPSTGAGRLWKGRGFRMLHLPCVRGIQHDGKLAAGPASQADWMFTNAEQGLAAHGFSYSQVVRTWIYVDRLLDWYGDLNCVRTAHYRRLGFGTTGGPAFPASTGIQGRFEEEECLVDVLALETDGRHATAAPVTRSPRQDQSFNYGSAFSRGMTLDVEGRRTIHISGTASINTAGDSTHLGDAEMQSLETLMSIAAILQEQGGTLENITSATLFCKTREAWEAWRRVSQLLRLPAFPKVCVLADVCRDNLLVEMEAVAVI
ncbi:hypothetical protein DB347_12190 [Opitutaceae bacterium EW11]|nr:hypothetical protein DB347_12190 [Opitutaceae bacterium EW11]